MKKNNVKFARKEFLNLPGHEAGASITTHIVCEKPGKNGYRYPDVVLAISDCQRVVNLVFEMDSKYEREYAIHKVETLIDVLSDFKKSGNNFARIADANKLILMFGVIYLSFRWDCINLFVRFLFLVYSLVFLPRSFCHF